jgi:hypothetical protein
MTMISTTVTAVSSGATATVLQRTDAPIRREDAAAWKKLAAGQKEKPIKCPKLARLERNLGAARTRVSTLDTHKEALLSDIKAYNENQEKHQGRLELAGAADCLDRYYGQVEGVLVSLASEGRGDDKLLSRVRTSRQQLAEAKDSLK